MDTTAHSQVKGLLQQALDQPEALREDFVELANGYSQAVKREVLSLIQARDSLPTILDGADIQQFLAPGRIGPGRRIGDYILAEPLGDGGSATVFRALHANPDIERAVAIKILDRTAATEEALLRFRREARLLSLLEHPGIVRLYDLGATPEGLPYLVTERIAGKTITEFAANLPEQSILELFLKVADAIAAAHRHLIVHRDLKPSNILVDATGQPKILDFGIALLLSEDERLTRTGLEPMTVRYASPEQVRRERQVTTLSDVYSLSVTLYELLAKRSPYGKDLDPYALAAKVAKAAILRPPAGTIHRDLEAILLKGLSSEPSDRYQSVDQLADDLRNYLSKRPVTAKTPTPLYTAQKFVSRNKLPCAFALVFLAVVTAFVVLLNREREIALRRSSDMTELAGTSLGEVVVELRQVPGALRAIKILYEQRVAVLQRLLKDEPRNHDAKRKLILALFNLGTVQGHPQSESVGLTAEALRTFQVALDLAEEAYREHPGPEEMVDVCHARNYVAELHHAMAQFPEAAIALSECASRMTDFLSAAPEPRGDTRTVLALSRSLLALNHAMLGRAVEYRREIDEALALRELDLRQSAKADEQRLVRQLSITLVHAAEGALRLGDPRSALDYARRGLAIEEPSFDIDPRISTRFYLARHLNNTARALHSLGVLEEAEHTATRAIEHFEVLSAGEPDAASFRTVLDRATGHLRAIRQDRRDR